MTDTASWYKHMNDSGHFVHHYSVNQAKEEYVRDEGEKVISTSIVEDYYSIFKCGMCGGDQNCSERPFIATSPNLTSATPLARNLA